MKRSCAGWGRGDWLRGDLQDEGDIQVGNHVAPCVHLPPGLVQELFGITSFPSRVGIGEELANIWECKRSENGIGGTMIQYVSI